MLAGGLGLVAELLQLGAEGGMVELADRRIVLPDLTVPQCLPIALEIAGEVCDHGMDMALRIERAARVMGKEGIDEIAGPLGLAVAAAFVIAGLGELLLDKLRHGRTHRGQVRIQNPPVARDQCQDRGRLGHRKGKIEA